MRRRRPLRSMCEHRGNDPDKKTDSATRRFPGVFVRLRWNNCRFDASALRRVEARLGEWGCEFPEETFYAWGGRPVTDIIGSLNEEQGLQMPVERVAARKEEYYYEFLPQLQPVPEVVEHIEAQHGRIPFAVVSGSSRESVTESLRTLRLLDHFRTLVCAGDYRNGKPHPEAFLMAADRLGLAPEACWSLKIPRWASKRQRQRAWPQ